LGFITEHNNSVTKYFIFFILFVLWVICDEARWSESTEVRFFDYWNG